MGRELGHDIALAQAWGNNLRDAVRLVARVTLVHAEDGRAFSEAYLRDLHRMMVATA